MSSCVLHTIDASPRGSTFEDCLRIIQTGDALVLLGDAVYAAATNANVLDELISRNISIYALQRDCEARGATPKAEILSIDVVGLVILTEEYPRQLAWY